MIRSLAAIFLPVIAFAAELPIPVDDHAKMIAELTAQVTKLDDAIKAAPDSVALYSQRGDAHLFLGHFAESVADFEKMIALKPSEDAPHWRLGIAYYFNGAFEKSSKQFVKYQDYETGDRENGIWKFLADAKVLGLEAARKAMLEYTRFDREPFPALYTMFATGKTDDLFTEMKAKKLTENEDVMFFANYYAGLNESLLDHREKALELLHKAVAGGWKHRRGDEPSYMWQVARLHYDAIANSKPSEK